MFISPGHEAQLSCVLSEDNFTSLTMRISLWQQSHHFSTELPLHNLNCQSVAELDLLDHTETPSTSCKFQPFLKAEDERTSANLCFTFSLTVTLDQLTTNTSSCCHRWDNTTASKSSVNQQWTLTADPESCSCCQRPGVLTTEEQVQH